MSLEVQVVRLLVSALVPQLIQFEVLFAPLMQALRPSDELLPLVGMDAADVFLQRQGRIVPYWLVMRSLAISYSITS